MPYKVGISYDNKILIKEGYCAHTHAQNRDICDNSGCCLNCSIKNCKARCPCENSRKRRLKRLAKIEI